MRLDEAIEAIIAVGVIIMYLFGFYSVMRLVWALIRLVEAYL